VEPKNEAFIILKDLLISEPLLSYPDITKPLVLTTDASNEALNAILIQGPIGRNFPIAHASRTLANAEKNYSITENDLLGIVWSCKRFRQYLYGRKFTIVMTTNFSHGSLM